MSEFNLEAAAEVMGELLRRKIEYALEVVMPAVEKVYGAVHEDYVAQGAIYGDTPNGMLRWMRELSEANKLLIRAAYIQQRHRMLRDFKAELERKRVQGNGK